MYEQYYIDARYVPKIFKVADRIMEAKIPQEVKDRINEPKEIPMPYIDSNPNVPGPVFVTKDWYFKKKRKRMIEQAEEVRDVHIEMMQLLAKKDMLKIKLGELDPAKKSDSKRIVAINVEIKDIDAELEMLAWQFGIDLQELDHGTRLARFVGRLKRKAKKIGKRIKRYWKDNSDFILNMAAIIVPVVATFVCKLLF